MGIFGGFFHKSGHESPVNDDSHHATIEDHIPTDDEILGEDEEIMRAAYLEKLKNNQENNGNEVLDNDIKV